MKAKKNLSRKTLRYLTRRDEIEESGISTEEVKLLLRYTQKVKHRILLELIYGLGLSVEDAVNIKLSDLDLISGLLYIEIENQFKYLPKRLHNLIKFYLQNQESKMFLLETFFGKLQEGAAESIIHALSRRILGRVVTSYDLQESYHSRKIFNPLDSLAVQSYRLPKLQIYPLPLLTTEGMSYS